MIPTALRAETFRAAFQGSPQFHSHNSSNIYWAPTQQGRVSNVMDAGEIRLMS